MENPASTKVTVNNHHSAVKPPCLHLPQPRDAPATLNSKTCSEVAVNHEAPPRLHEPAIQNPKNHSLFVLSRLRHSQTQNPRSNQKRKRKTLTTILHRAPMSLVPTMPVATGGIVDAPLFHCFYFEFHCWGLLIQSMIYLTMKEIENLAFNLCQAFGSEEGTFFLCIFSEDLVLSLHMLFLLQSSGIILSLLM